MDNTTNAMANTTIDPERLLRYRAMLAADAYMREQANFVNSFVPPILVATGIVGNVLTFVILRRMNLPASSLLLYLRTFLVMSTLVLVMFPGQEWMLDKLRLTPIVDTSDVMCRLWNFLSSVILYSPIWLAVMMTLDQCIVAWRTKLALSVCTPFTAKLIMTMISIALVALSIHSMWMYEMAPNKRCNRMAVGDVYYHIVWPWLTLFVSIILPLLMILPSTIALIIALLKTSPVTSPVATAHKTNRELMICVAILTGCIFLTSATTTAIIILGICISPSITRSIGFRMTDLIFQMLTIAYYAIPMLIFLVFSSSFRFAIRNCVRTLKKRLLKRRSRHEVENMPLNNVKVNNDYIE